MKGEREKGKDGGRENNLFKNLSNNAIQEKKLPPSGITMRTKATFFKVRSLMLASEQYQFRAEHH